MVDLEAQMLLHSGDGRQKKKHLYFYGAVWAAGGAMLTGLAWLLTVLF